MNSIEAMKALIEGKKIRNISWGKDCYIKIVNNQIVFHTMGHFGNGSFDTLHSWDEYKEPDLIFEEFIVGFRFLWDQNQHCKYVQCEVVYCNEHIFVYRHCLEDSGEYFYYTTYNFEFSEFFKHIKRI